MTKPTVYNKLDFKQVPEGAMYVGRGTSWGNPFIMKSERERMYVCLQFTRYANWRLSVEPGWLSPLKGLSLVCHCAPKECHADTLLRLANDKI